MKVKPLITFIVVLGFLVLTDNRPPEVVPKKPFVEKITIPQKVRPDISVEVPLYLNYDKCVSQLKKWNKEAPQITEIGVYGKSHKGRDLYYFRISAGKKDKPKVLITACIHGDEKIATATVMAYIGKMLASYTVDEEVTDIIDTRDVYFIPIVSPDSYETDQRHVLGKDPNRNFNASPSVPAVQGLKEFFLKHKFKAYSSGHSSGRIFIYAYGNKLDKCPHHKQYVDLLGRMEESCGYGLVKGSAVYGRPIYGTDVDWGYSQGAFSIVTEYGRDFHQRDIKGEVDKTYRAFLLFMKEAPIIFNEDI